MGLPVIVRSANYAQTSANTRRQANGSLLNATATSADSSLSGDGVSTNEGGSMEWAAAMAFGAMFILLFAAWGTMGMPTDHMTKALKEEKKSKALTAALSAAEEAGDGFNEDAWLEEYDRTKGKLNQPESLSAGRIAGAYASSHPWALRPDSRPGSAPHSTLCQGPAANSDASPMTAMEIMREIQVLENRLRHLERAEQRE